MITKGAKVGVLTRVDLIVDRPKRLLAAAHRLDPDLFHDSPDPLYTALAALVTEYGGDELADHPGRYGLVGGDSSTVLVREDADEEPWLETWPPDVVDARVLLRIDGGLALEAAQHLADPT